jgi:hypothetical protein
MKKSTKAVLLSALVFPGAGHFFLKKRISGAIIAVASLAAFYLIVSNMLERVRQFADKILSGEVNLDEAAIAELLSRQPVGSESQLLDIAWAVLIISWLIGIVDSYRCGRTQDESE